jgi:hypothetical protein
MDILVPRSMKTAAKCDKSCELQNVNHQIVERKWHFFKLSLDVLKKYIYLR